MDKTSSKNNSIKKDDTNTAQCCTRGTKKADTKTQQKSSKQGCRCGCNNDLDLK